MKNWSRTAILPPGASTRQAYISHEQDHPLTELSVPQKVTPRQPKPRVSRTKGHLSKKTAFVRDIVKEVSGYVYH